MVRKCYTAPWARVARVRIEWDYVYSPGSVDTNPDNNEMPVDGGIENF